MPSIFSDQMRDQILDEFKGVEVPRLSQSIINRFGQNPRNEGVGQLSRSQGFLIGENDPTSQHPGPIWDFPNDFPVPNENPDRPRSVPSPPRQNPLQPPELPPYEGPLPPQQPQSERVQSSTQGEEGGVDYAELYKNLANRRTWPETGTPPSDALKEKYSDFTGRRRALRIPEVRGMNRGGGLGALEAEQYRAAVDAPLYAKKGTPGGVGSNFMNWFTADKAADQPPSLDDILGLLKSLSGLFGSGIKTPAQAPQYKAPKAAELEGIGGIGMNDGGTVLNRRLFLGGGEVDGAGGERDDLVPIWASDREYVVSANGVKRMGGGNHSRGIAALDEVNNNGRLV